MQDQDALIREARLLVSRAEDVFQDLKSYAERTGDSFFSSGNGLEKNLLARGEPLIDLGLAAFGYDKGVVRELYRRSLEPTENALTSAYKKGLRLACLSNHVLAGRFSYLGFASEVLGESETMRVLADSDTDEAATLVRNPTVGDKLLAALYTRKKPLDRLPDDRWLSLVAYSAQNPRLTTNRDNDAGPDLGHYAIHRGIYEMLEIAPVTVIAMHRIYDLLIKLEPGHVHSLKPVNTILERWATIETEDVKSDGYYTSLSMHDEFRCLIAALYGRWYSDGKSGISGNASSADVAHRCAFYARANLTKKEMKEGKVRDGNVFAFAALLNDSLLSRSDLRKVFEEECLSGDGNIHRYRDRCEQIHKHKAWFNPRPSADWLNDDSEVQEKNPIEQVREEMAQENRALSVLGRRVERVEAYVITLLGGAFAVLAYFSAQRTYGLSESVAGFIAGAVFVGFGMYAQFTQPKNLGS